MATKQTKLLINSNYRENGSTIDQFDYLLDNGLNEVKSLTINQIVIPHFFYPFTSADNVVEFQVVSDTDYTMTFPLDQGWTTGSSFASWINSNKPTDISGNPLSALTASYDDDTGRITFTLSAGTFTLTGTALAKLGFTNSTIYGSASASQEAQAITNLSRTSVIYVRLNTIEGNTASNRVQSVKDLLAIVPVSSNFGENISYSYSGNNEVSINGEYIQRLEISLYDDMMRPLFNLSQDTNAVISIVLDLHY